MAVEPVALDHYSPDSLVFHPGAEITPVGSGFLVSVATSDNPRFVVADTITEAARTIKTILADKS